MKRRMDAESYSFVAREVATKGGGDTSHAGRERLRQGKGLDPLVDPAAHGLIRKSLPRHMEQAGLLVRPNGIPMLVESNGDTTGSMGNNVSIMFQSLPLLYSLLTGGKTPVLGRYDTQIINGIFGDQCDNYILYRSQAEMDQEIARQLTLMVPEANGGDPTEDPDYALFAAAYLTDAFINRYGLKSYHFLITDADARGRVDHKNLVRVFGSEVYAKATENGYQVNEHRLPPTKEIVKTLLTHAHAFMLQVNGHRHVTDFWIDLYGTSRVVQIGTTRLLPYFQAVIIGLTEGMIDLQSAEEYLRGAGCGRDDAREIVRAVAHIPVGAQMDLPNFHELPMAGTMYQTKEDLWPVDSAGTADSGESPAGEDTWL